MNLSHLKTASPDDFAAGARMDQMMAKVRQVVIETDPDDCMRLLNDMAALQKEVLLQHNPAKPGKVERQFFRIRGEVVILMSNLAIYGYNSIMAAEWERRQGRAD